MVVYLECTSTYSTEINTGIQRVVRNIVASASAARPDLDIIPVVLTPDGLRQVDALDVCREKKPTGNEPTPSIAPVASRIKCILRSSRQLILAALPRGMVRNFLSAPRHHAGLTHYVCRAVGIAVDKPSAEVAPLIVSEDPRPIVLPSAGDTLILLDVSWDHLDRWSAIHRARADGAYIVAVTYDLIPLSHPQHCAPSVSPLFALWWSEVAKVSHHIVGISKFSADQASAHLEFLKLSGVIRNKPSLGHFHLGSKLDWARTRGPLSPDVAKAFDCERHAFLVVGSIDPRKNPGLILRAFERLWADGHESSLVVIGKEGWDTQTIDAMVHHSERGKRLFVIRDASDTDLAYAYDNGSATIMASEIEGFGLPIVESFQRGLPVLCSDIPVFRELADERAAFFELTEKHLGIAIMDFCTRVPVAQRKERTPIPWLTWEDSARSLFLSVSQPERDIRGQNQGGCP